MAAGIALGIAAGFVAERAEAACASPAPASPDVVAQFKASPDAALTRDGASLVSFVRNLAASDTSTLPGIAALVANATPDQRAAIGTGLAQAAAICVARDPQATQDIQRAVITADNGRLTTAFQAAAGDVRTAAVGGGAAGGGGGGGGGGSLGGSGLGGGAASGGGGAAFVRNSDTATTLNSSGSFASSGSRTLSLTSTRRTAVTGSVSP